MRKTNTSVLKLEDRMLIDTPGLQALLSCGRSSAIRIGMDAGARVNVGKRVLWNRQKLENYLTKITF